MTDSRVVDYGWSSGDPTYSCDYLAPVVLRVLRDLGAQRVLDLGAGNGNLCQQLARAGFEVVGVEPDQHGVEIARRLHQPIPFHRHSVDDDPALLMRHEAVFDTVVSTEVIEHLYSPHRLALFARSVLKDGGHLVVTTPYHGYIKNLALSLLDKWDHHHTALWHGGHIKFFSRATLTSLLQNNGFETVRFIGVGRLPWLWKSMLVVAKKRT